MAPSNVLMIVSNSVRYDPRVTLEAQALTRQGHRVTVLGWDRESSLPETEEDGMTVVRLRNTTYMRLLPFNLLRLRPWWRLAYRRGVELSRQAPFDVVHCHDLDTLPTGVRLKRILGVPLVYDAHEIWGFMLAQDVPKFVANHFLRKEERLLRQVDAIITVGEPLRRYFERLATVPVTVVLNAKPVVSETYVPPGNDSLTVLYIGTLKEDRLVEELVGVVGGLPGVRLVTAGIGKPNYVGRLRERAASLENVEFLGRVPQGEVLPLTLQADVVVCLTDPTDKNSSVALANKLFEAMASGRPIVVSEGTYQAQFVREHGVGIAVEHSREGVREGLVRLRDDPQLRLALGKRALQKALDQFNWARQERRLLSVYGALGLC